MIRAPTQGDAINFSTVKWAVVTVMRSCSLHTHEAAVQATRKSVVHNTHTHTHT